MENQEIKILYEYSFKDKIHALSNYLKIKILLLIAPAVAKGRCLKTVFTRKIGFCAENL